MHLLFASANLSATPDYQNFSASLNSTTNFTIPHVFPQNVTWPNTTWTSNSSINLTPSYWQWEPSTGSYNSLLDVGSSLMHVLFGLNNSLDQTVQATTEAPAIRGSAPSRSASTLLNLLFGINSSSVQLASNSISDGPKNTLLHTMSGLHMMSRPIPPSWTLGLHLWSSCSPCKSMSLIGLLRAGHMTSPGLPGLTATVS